jgi:hypothetical protein
MAWVKTNGGKSLCIGIRDVIGAKAKAAPEVFRQLRKKAGPSPLGWGVCTAEVAFRHVIFLSPHMQQGRLDLRG